MSMHDPQLITLMVRQLRQSFSLYRHRPDDVRAAAIALHDAINASGIAWIAPWDATDRMAAVGIRKTPWPERNVSIFAKMRDAHLAEKNFFDELLSRWVRTLREAEDHDTSPKEQPDGRP